MPGILHSFLNSGLFSSKKQGHKRLVFGQDLQDCFSCFYQQFSIRGVIASTGRFSRGEAISPIRLEIASSQKTLLAMT
jgi:hypothetical protein